MDHSQVVSIAEGVARSPVAFCPYAAHSTGRGFVPMFVRQLRYVPCGARRELRGRLTTRLEFVLTVLTRGTPEPVTLPARAI